PYRASAARDGARDDSEWGKVAKRCLPLRLDYNIAQRSNSFDHHFHRVSGNDWAYALGRAGGNQVSRHERHDLANMTDNHVERENEIPRVVLLTHDSVDSGFHPNPRPRIDFVCPQRAYRTERVEALGASELDILVLQIARGHVVNAGVAENIGTNILIGCQLVAFFSDDNAELAFVVHP